MTSSNLTRLTLVRETTPGTTPNTPRMRTVRFTGENLNSAPEYIDSEEIKSDRMVSDPLQIMKNSSGEIQGEISYPVDESPLSEFIRSAMFSTWQNTPQRDNDGTADSVITAVTNSTDVYTVTTGAAFVASQLVRASGFTNAANNGVFKVTTGGATSVAVLGANLVAESAPPGAARLKVVGFEGASGDITALADGLGSTSLDFTTLGLAVGQWVKIGGEATGTQFAFLVTAGAIARAAAFARITAITATKLTLDNLPTGWTTDDGTGKTIRVWFGDYIKNGTTLTAHTIEKGFLGQAVPSYFANAGAVGNTLGITMTSKQTLKYTYGVMALGGTQGTTSLDASPDAETTGQVMASHSNVGRLSEGGSRVTSPNWASEFSATINNNIEMIEAVDESYPVAHRVGECTVTGAINTVFGSLAIVQKFHDGTVTSFSSRIAKNNQAIILTIPRATLRGGGNPVASGRNQTVRVSFDYSASKDTLTNSHIQMDRFEFFQ